MAQVLRGQLQQLEATKEIYTGKKERQKYIPVRKNEIKKCIPEATKEIYTGKKERQKYISVRKKESNIPVRKKERKVPLQKIRVGVQVLFHNVTVRNVL